MKNEISNMTCPMCNQAVPKQDGNPIETIQRLDKLEERYILLEAQFHMLERAYKYLESIVTPKSIPHNIPAGKSSEPYSNA